MKPSSLARGVAVAVLCALATTACGATTGPPAVSAENSDEPSESVPPTEPPADDGGSTTATEPPADDGGSTTPTEPPADDGGSTTPQEGTFRCIVYLHGKSGSGGETRTNDDGIVIVSPDGNGTGWGGLQWEYESSAKLEEATASIVAGIDAADCGSVVIHGFSNGASMAAALHCSGNDLDGRLRGTVVDDPVTDSATIGCTPATDNLALYWTGSLARSAPAGTNCAQIDWTCAGDTIRGIEAYASDLGVSAIPSPHSDHQWNFQTELPFTWLG